MGGIVDSQLAAVLPDTVSAGPTISVVVGAEAAEPGSTHGRYATKVKPVFDVVLAAALFLLTLPAMLVIAMAIRVSMGPGVIYRQRRVGRHGRPFTVYKFRTMLHDRRSRAQIRVTDPAWDGLERRVCHKREDDPRHTPVGRVLRKLGLDELPQLANVLLGQMSLVGPRPELVEVVERYEPWQHARHQVKPGITGLWQVSERGQGLMCENTSTDIAYVANVSLRTDLRVLARTVPAALIRRSGS